MSYTNGWDEYQTITVPDINLVAGTYVFSMVVDRSPFNYSWMNAELIEADTDNDGVADGLDGCPTDPNKIAPGDLSLIHI